MLRILIADDHEIVRNGLRAMLSDEDGWEIVAEAADGRDAVSQAQRTKPDVAIVDYALPVMNGVEAARQIRLHSPKTEVLIFTQHDNEALLRDVLEAGIKGYLLKSDAAKHLIHAVEALSTHQPFFTRSMSEALVQAYLSKPNGSTSVLSVRERSVVQLIAEGHSNRQAATLLNVSEKTIETHRASAMRKLDAHSTAALVRYAVRNRLVEP
ncbi:two component transcriptional regulator, LuxR family [Mesorhizobium albiziae]|jgi:DNA-binding NarL/FixJ family response regulator|uniref:Two component transcriptional regulator, LuxR family n=2 Tax=Neomesorhizobium albiziae TaxID=335020 RepID=A0A1I3VN81_9HYPH|nr:response regulator transcription factor [Mesorhizobium albiziae]GLS29063.1 DNA-binding response regulator [Mesorhizobium albiziae]SFJ96838.1 two component transcriptional regulator, LuxR family [Mesorhizobium albiziae]